jgi:NADPH:quinone reductase-like Zn-dependent oxidoreductase
VVSRRAGALIAVCALQKSLPQTASLCARARRGRRIDYRAQGFTRVVSDCDAVFDTVGGEVALRSFAVLRPGGRLASVASGGAAPASPRPDATSLRPKVNRDRPHLDRVAALVGLSGVPLRW